MVKQKFEEYEDEESIKIKPKSKKPNYKKELEDGEINISLTENEVIVIYGVMKKMLATGKIKVDQFLSKCKYCDRTIKMMNHGFGWKAFNLKNDELHKCDEGIQHYKSQHFSEEE